MKIKWLSLVFFCTLLVPSIGAAKSDVVMLNSMSFKLSVILNGEEVEWEYINPDEYEWETGSKVIKGEQAEAAVKEIFQSINIQKDAKVEDILAEIRKKPHYEKIERLDVRWIDRDGKLYTWVWEQK